MTRKSRWIDTSAMLADCLTKTVTSGRLGETLSTGIFDMRPTDESLAIQAKKTASGGRRRKSRNGRRIPVFELLTLALLGESDSVLVKLPGTWKREICQLMLQMLSPSTGSECLRPPLSSSLSSSRFFCLFSLLYLLSLSLLCLRLCLRVMLRVVLCVVSVVWCEVCVVVAVVVVVVCVRCGVAR